jgi:hypothetical protein
MTKKPTSKQQHVNFDYLVYKFAQIMLQDESRLHWDVRRINHSVNQVKGHNFFSYHGEQIRSWSGFPFYGMMRDAMSRTAAYGARGIPLNYILLGHFHQSISLPKPGYGEILVNGTVKGIDEWIDKKGSATIQPPTQWAFGINKKRGVSWRIPFELEPNTFRNYEKAQDSIDVIS